MDAEWFEEWQRVRVGGLRVTQEGESVPPGAPAAWFGLPLGRMQPLSEGFMELEARGIEWTPRYPGYTHVSYDKAVMEDGSETSMWALAWDMRGALAMATGAAADKSMSNDIPGIFGMAAKVAATPVPRLSGPVITNNGQHTVWVNGHAVEPGGMARAPVPYEEGVAAAADRSISNDIPGILSHAARTAALPAPQPPAPPPERKAPEGVTRAYGFDHRMGSAGTHGGGRE